MSRRRSPTSPLAAVAFAAALAGPACGTAATAPPDAAPAAWALRLRTDVAGERPGRASGTFDVVDVQRDEDRCTLRAWAGKAHGRSQWRERRIALPAGECATLWQLFVSVAAATPAPAEPAEVPGAGRRFRLTARWQLAGNGTRPGPWRTATRAWEDGTAAADAPALQRLADRLRAWPRRLALPPDAPSPTGVAAPEPEREASPASPSGVRGHVSHPRGVPWDARTVYPVTVVVLDEHGNELRSTATDENGDYRIALPPGTYTLCPGSCSNPILRRQRKRVVVAPGSMATLDLHFDSGIR